MSTQLIRIGTGAKQLRQQARARERAGRWNQARRAQREREVPPAKRRARP